MNDQFGGIAVDDSPATDEFGGVAFNDTSQDEFGGIAVAEEVRRPAISPIGTLPSSRFDVGIPPSPDNSVARTLGTESFIPKEQFVQERFRVAPPENPESLQPLVKADEAPEYFASQAPRPVAEAQLAAQPPALENKPFSPQEAEAVNKEAIQHLKAYPTRPFVEIGKHLGITPQQLSDALDVLSGMGAQIEAVTIAAPSPSYESLAGQQQRKPTEIENVAAGSQQAIVDSLDFFTSPLGIATLGSGALPKLGQRAVALAFVYDMAKKSPEQLQQFLEAKYAGDTAAMAKGLTGMGLTGAFILEGTRHSLQGAKADVADLVNRIPSGVEKQQVGVFREPNERFITSPPDQGPGTPLTDITTSTAPVAALNFETSNRFNDIQTRRAAGETISADDLTFEQGYNAANRQPEMIAQMKADLERDKRITELQKKFDRVKRLPKSEQAELDRLLEEAKPTKEVPTEAPQPGLATNVPEELQETETTKPETPQKETKPDDTYREIRQITSAGGSPIWQVWERPKGNRKRWTTTNFNSEAEAQAYVDSFKPKTEATATTEKKVPPAVEFHNLIRRYAGELGWSEGDDLLALTETVAAGEKRQHGEQSIKAKVRASAALQKARRAIEIEMGLPIDTLKYPKNRAEQLAAFKEFLEKKRRIMEEKRAREEVEKPDDEGIDQGDDAIEAWDQETQGGAGPGGTVPEDVGTKAQIEQLTGAMKGVAVNKPRLIERIKQAFNIGAAKDAAKNAVGKTLDGLRAAGDFLKNTWQGISRIDDIERVKGLLSEELETRGWRLRQAAKQFAESIPDIRVREAISKWIDAGGDEVLLAEQAKSVPANRRAAYERALRLTPEEKLAATHIKNYFESRLQEAIDAGVLDHGIEDYIHRIYKRDTPWKRNVIGQIQSGVLNTRTPGLALKRIFQYDADAEAAGYNVVSDFIPRVLDYEASLSKAIASRAAVKRFMDVKMPDGRPMIDVGGLGVPVPKEGAREATLIKPSFKPGEEGKLNNRKDYVARNYPALKKWKWTVNDENGNPILVQGDVLIHPDAAARIDALLKPSAIRTSQSLPAKIGRVLLEAGSVFKQTMLDFSGFHQTQITVHGMEHGVSPFHIISDIDFENPNVTGLLRGGVTLGGEGAGTHFAEGLVGQSLSRRIPGLGPLMQSYQTWLFQDYIPRIKMTMALKALERNRQRFSKELASGKMSEEALNRITANEANAAFGEQNYIMLERSKTSQDLARMILLAPDFLESRGRFAGQALTKQGGEQRMALLLGALTMYITARLLNKGIDDQWHFEPENLFNVVYKGHSYGLRTVQGDILHLLEEPVRFWLHRLNPVTTRPIMQLLTGRDEFGRKRTSFQTIGDTIKNIVPISMRNSREQKLWESMLNAFGVTERRYNEVTNAYKLAADWKKKNNIAPEPGEFIYDPDKDPYRPIRLALLEHDATGAKSEIDKLVKSGAANEKQIVDHFRKYIKAPFAGSRQNEIRFVQSLNADQKKTYEAALAEKERIAKTFIEAYK